MEFNFEFHSLHKKKINTLIPKRFQRLVNKMKKRTTRADRKATKGDGLGETRIAPPTPTVPSMPLKTLLAAKAATHAARKDTGAAPAAATSVSTTKNVFAVHCTKPFPEVGLKVTPLRNSFLFL